MQSALCLSKNCSRGRMWQRNIYYMTIMKNRITTTITTMMLMLFCSSINIFAQSENVVPSGYTELDEWVKQCKVERPNALGYPGNYDSKLDSFYDWYTQNKMENILINNAGDPFGNPSTLSSLKFEREVIESFAPLYGFDLAFFKACKEIVNRFFISSAKNSTEKSDNNNYAGKYGNTGNYH